MKKIVLMSILVSGVLFAEGAEKANRIKTMQSLEASMATIQKGFLYNNKDVVGTGITKLKEKLKNIDSFVIKNEKDESFNAQAYATTETEAITKLADKMETAYNGGKKDEALTTYTKTLSRCMTCHKIIRKW